MADFSRERKRKTYSRPQADQPEDGCRKGRLVLRCGLPRSEWLTRREVDPQSHAGTNPGGCAATELSSEPVGAIIAPGLLQAGYFYYLISHHHRVDVIEQSQTMLVERAVDGIIAIDTSLQRHRPLPTVTVSCPDKHDWVTNIVLNHTRAAELAIDHLTGLGHRHIAVIKGQAFSSDTEPRWQAIQHAAAAANLKLKPELVAQLEGDSPSHEPGYFAAQRLLASKAPFTAIFAFNDVSAIGAIRAVREAGLRVPQDVSVVGFDDVQSAAFQNPALTTVRQPLRTMGILAAEAIISQIASPGEHPPSRQVIVDPELVVRDSTCPPSQKKSPRH